MRGHWFRTLLLATVAALGVAAPAQAFTETQKFIELLSVNSDGTIAVMLKNGTTVAANCAYSVITLPATGNERDRMFGMLLAARTANVPVTVAFGSDCKITIINIQ